MPSLKTNNKNDNKININLPKELSSVYSNLVNISVSKNEIFFDFITVSPTDAKVASRVIMSVEHTKDFAKVLNNLIKKLK
ncbi:MAG: DUF3467 domain-containing protein [bacterium]